MENSSSIASMTMEVFSMFFPVPNRSRFPALPTAVPGVCWDQDLWQPMGKMTRVQEQEQHLVTDQPTTSKVCMSTQSTLFKPHCLQFVVWSSPPWPAAEGFELGGALACPPDRSKHWIKKYTRVLEMMMMIIIIIIIIIMHHASCIMHHGSSSSSSCVMFMRHVHASCCVASISFPPALSRTGVPVIQQDIGLLLRMELDHVSRIEQTAVMKLMWHWGFCRKLQPARNKTNWVGLHSLRRWHWRDVGLAEKVLPWADHTTIELLRWSVHVCIKALCCCRKAKRHETDISKKNEKKHSYCRDDAAKERHYVHCFQKHSRVDHPSWLNGAPGCGIAWAPFLGQSDAKRSLTICSHLFSISLFDSAKIDVKTVFLRDTLLLQIVSICHAQFHLSWNVPTYSDLPPAKGSWMCEHSIFPLPHGDASRSQGAAPPREILGKIRQNYFTAELTQVFQVIAVSDIG